jgi:uncharacterized LabA/DUF88 family protein
MSTGGDHEPPRAYVYVDGFNFYYGCFRGRGGREHWRDYRWLNLQQFCTLAFPRFDIQKIRYFTARVEDAPDDLGQAERQATYLRALRTLPQVEIHEGRFLVTRRTRFVADPTVPGPVRKEPPERVVVLQPEEKGSDVNLASHLLLDGFRDRYDVAIVVSNDSDLAEPIRIARLELGRDMVLLNPRSSFARDLQNTANHYRKVREVYLREAQFPDTLEDEDGIIRKPAEWKAWASRS